MRSQYCSDCHEGIKLEKPVNGPAAQLPESLAHCADDAEPDEHCEKEYLTYASDCYDFHNGQAKPLRVKDPAKYFNLNKCGLQGKLRCFHQRCCEDSLTFQVAEDELFLTLVAQTCRMQRKK